MPQISIIIPVYNVEKYLRRCLDSVLAQTFTGYECILVDDDSPDTCPKICDEYAEKDGRFRVIHKKQNEGLPKARKSGLDKAAAEFVIHVDSDDWLEPGALELLYNKQQETGADIVMGDIRIFYPFKTKTRHFPAIKEDTDILVYYFLYNCVFIWGKLYKKKLFDNYILPEMNLGEDIVVTCQLFYKTSKGKFQTSGNIVYNYDCCTKGMSSNTHIRVNHYSEYPSIKIRLWAENYLGNLPLNENEKAAFQCYMIRNGINPYLKHTINVPKSEIQFFYQKYFQNCIYISKIRISDRLILPIFKKSMIAGKLYIIALNLGLHIVKRILTVFHRCFSI